MSAAAELYTPATLVADAVRHLLKQGVPAAQSNGECRYLMPDGRKCAIGGLMDGASYTSNMEGGDLHFVMYDTIPRFRELPPSKRAKVTTAAVAIQDVHDGWATHWKTGSATSADKAIERLDRQVPGWREQLKPIEVRAFINLISNQPSS